MTKRLTEDSGNTSQKEMSFLDHLEELRWHIIRSIIAILSVAILVFVFKNFVFENIIFAPKKAWFPTYKLFGMEPFDFDLKAIHMHESFLVHIKVSFFLGLVCAFPVVFNEFWKFIKPGLYAKERKAARGMVLVCSLLFMMGVSFGYYIVAPFGINFLASYSVGVDVENAPTLASYISYLLMFTLPTGLVFELPVIIYFLAKIGLVTAPMMRSYRKHAFVGILILAATLTPPDILSQFLIGVPVYLLYEISIFIAKHVEKKNKEKESA